MPKKTVLFVPLVLFVLSVLTSAVGAADPRLEGLVQAVLRDGSATAIDYLRREGPTGMDALLAVAGSGSGSSYNSERAVDRVCGVRDCRDIRLFWYTDLEAAKAAARATGRPILSLRLLGRLDEELSCANSRFFRTVHYKNRQTNALLRDGYILHWRSVRPVPRVTIDFGDGTRLERTLTGNSIHYVLDSRGRLIEALPGLSGPEAFRSALDEAAQAVRHAEQLDDAALVPWLTARHQRALAERVRAFTRESRSASPPAARNTATLLDTASKRVSEISLLSALDGVSDETLQALAGLRRPRVHLDAPSRAFLLRKQGVTDLAGAELLVDSFEATLALDEVINEYRMGPAILKKLSDPEAVRGLDLEAFNQWVYEDVFRTPLSDPWLGLAPENVYVALPASTRIEAARPER